VNNRLVQLSEEEIAEITRILAELTEQVRSDRGPLEFAAAGIAYLDSVFARARFAREFDCTIPDFSTGNSLRLERSEEHTSELQWNCTALETEKNCVAVVLMPTR
jgi:DNA mismatch repair protein MutS2